MQKPFTKFLPFVLSLGALVSCGGGAKAKTATVTVINGTGGGTFNIGTSVTVTATVPEHKSFKEWQSEDKFVSDANPYTFTLEKDITLEATFTDVAQYTVSVINGNGSGTYEAGTTITVTPKLELGIFKSWKIGDDVVSTDKAYSFVVNSNVTIKADIDGSDPMQKYCSYVMMQDEEFKVLNFADIQLHDGNDLTLTKHIIDTLVEQEEPDMIVILGDILNDHKDYDAKESSKTILEYIDSKNIPWAPLFGNHDNVEYHPSWTKKTVGVDYLMEIFSQCNNCLFKEGPSNVQGKSNYVVNVGDKNGNLVETFVILDSKTNGLVDSNVTFYNDAITYANKLYGSGTVPSVVFDHIPIQEYKDAYDISLSKECHDVVGFLGQDPLVCGDHALFNKMKELGSSKTMICGHDHEDGYYNTYNGITLAHGMKSSDGDDDEGVSFRHPLGGLTLTIDGSGVDKLEYARVEDVSYTMNGTEASKADFPYHPYVLPYWRHSGAKLHFDIELPDSGTVQLNLQGTNLMRGSVEEDTRQGGWNRLTANVDINASSKSTTVGTLTQIEGNKYHFEADVTDFSLNQGAGEVAYGDETLRIVYFHNATATFTITNVHFEFEEITEKDQVDLSNAVISKVEDQPNNGLPVRPKPSVTLNGQSLTETADIIYTYENNVEIGNNATLTIIPSGKGAHNYKGECTTTFNIIKNPDDDDYPGHENAKRCEDSCSFKDTEGFVSCNNWKNVNKSLHFEVKRLAYGMKKEGEVNEFSFMGTNANPGAPEGPTSNWNRLTTYYYFHFTSDNSSFTVTDSSESGGTVVATGVKMEHDNWFEVVLPLDALTTNEAQKAYGNENETLCRWDFHNMSRSFKLDDIRLVDDML
ncbi:MAG: metallophosphoesterase [Bacilli bacterium]|nr:metallophosphoesterase [Bacilli bacterium]